MKKNRCERALLNLKKVLNKCDYYEGDLYINGMFTEEVEGQDYEEIQHYKVMGLDLSHTNFGKIELEDLDFYDCDFSYCNFDNATIRGCNFINCVFNETTFEDTELIAIAFVDCYLDYAYFLNCEICNIKSTEEIKEDHLQDTYIERFTKIYNIEDLSEEEEEEEQDNPTL